MAKLEIEIVNTADLVPYANNSRIHTAFQIDAICESITKYGFNDPIAIWHNPDGDMEIVEGHGRLLALNKLGIEECPTICLDHLTDEQRRAYCIVHNATTDNSLWDFSILDNEAADLGLDLTVYGMSDDINVDDLFFEDNNTEGKTVVCPHCGERVIPTRSKD